MSFKSKIFIIFTLAINSIISEDWADELALYKELAREAQLVLKIPVERHAQVKKMLPSDSKYDTSYAYYHTKYNDIYVNTEKLNKLLYGSKRCTMFHEAVHVKYASFIDSYTEYQHEQMADSQGINATGCYICVQERTLRFDSQINYKSYLAKGYLPADEIHKIAKELKQQNKICLFHKPDSMEKKIDYYYHRYFFDKTSREKYDKMVADGALATLYLGVAFIMLGTMGIYEGSKKLLKYAKIRDFFSKNQPQSA